MSETDLAFARAALMSVVRGADADDVVQVSCRGRSVHLSGLAFRMLVDPRAMWEAMVAAPLPLGDGMLCAGGLWIVKVDRDCPICGATPRDDRCFRDLDDVNKETLADD